MPRWLKVILLILVVSLTALVAAGVVVWRDQGAATMAGFFSMAQPPAVVTSVPVEPVGATAVGAKEQLWNSKITAVGKLVSVHGIGVTSEVPGVIAEIFFESNQSVDKGQALIRLDSAVQEANIASGKAQLALAQQELVRLKKLRKRAVATEAELDRAAAQVAQLEAQLTGQRALLNQKVIRAPFAGRMGIRRVSLGQYLTPGTPIATLGTVDPIYVDFSVAEKHIPDLGTGYKVEVNVEAYPEEPIVGEVTSMESLVDVRTQTLGVRATIPNTDRKYRPGMFAQVEVVLPREEQVLVIPQTAVTFNPYGTAVWVVGDETSYTPPHFDPSQPKPEAIPAWKVVQKFIRTGETRGDFIVVTDGLSATDKVITSGQLKLRAGATVMFNNAAAPAAATNPAVNR